MWSLSFDTDVTAIVVAWLAGSWYIWIVGGKVLYGFFTSDMVGFLVSAHVGCIVRVLRQEYLANTDSGAKYTLYISLKSRPYSLAYRTSRKSKIQTDNNTKNPIQRNDSYSLKSYLLYRVTHFALKKGVIG